jgi:PilZ domain
MAQAPCKRLHHEDWPGTSASAILELGTLSSAQHKVCLDTPDAKGDSYRAFFGVPMAETGQEKRATRRFALRLPVSVTYSENGSQEKTAQTRDVSARGICFYLDSAITAGSPIEFTLTLPPEITLTESIRVRCKGKVVRVDNGAPDGKVAVAAVIDEYEFLSEA